MVEQGDIIKIEGVGLPALVVSKNLYNESGHVIACPIVSGPVSGTFAYPLPESGFVLYDNLRQFDLETRGYTVTGKVPLADLIRITDNVQSLFDYY
ncbi:MAG: type II toxin-antitoxin system PemK/MazF family toxin [Lachnospiraceae bacterium]|nr:type II toxin-antitoxin system PemK/MazF family toxin [Lachnospiraceae bacterium]